MRSSKFFANVEHSREEGWSNVPTAANGITRNVFKFQRKCGSNHQIANGCAKPPANCLITSYYNIAVSNAQLACRLQCVHLLDYHIIRSSGNTNRKGGNTDRMSLYRCCIPRSLALLNLLCPHNSISQMANIQGKILICVFIPLKVPGIQMPIRNMSLYILQDY